ncbi:hypothetical protein [Alteromonas lipolytica]|uniref:Solute-binding protein family 3/N-terminal domain-containing protein n=1 Tax=Alteromonas lipolytica TaxID=1856405 RepID=A0A1E8FJA3_9ALTE|nr:hypothetical protein [Alteromonas lipolytica]OFI36004.1 hypothetical protein BFC17_10015 [Alteromonas lipolytica]
MRAQEPVGSVTPDIRWVKNPSPPFHILDGQHKGYGICDVLVDKLNQRLGALTIDVEVYPQSRIGKLVEGTENLCFPCMIKRADTDRFTYSNSTTVYPPLGIIMEQQQFNLLYPEQPDALSLRQLLNNQSVLFGYAAARRFPDVLQSAIESHGDNSNVLALPGVLGPLRVLQQIKYNRIQYTLDYPGVLRYFALIEETESLIYRPTTEYGTAPVYGAIGCTNNAWGQKAVKAINSVLDDVLSDPEYVENQKFWLNSVPQKHTD